MIELRTRAPGAVSRADGAERDLGPELVIDGEAIPWGRLPDGLYYLDEYAYDWQEDLMDLAERLIDYRARISESSRVNVTRR